MDSKGPPGCFARVFSAVPKSLRISSALSNVALGKGQPSLGLLAGQGFHSSRRLGFYLF